LSKIADALGISLTLSLEYLLFAGTVFFFFYIWKKKAFWYLKIQQKYPGKAHVLREAKYSFFTVIIFGLVILPVMWASKERYTLVYYPINKYGYVYYVFSILLMIVLHDAYYYWMHRLLHWEKIFKYVHKTHHLSLNPTPFSAYALHPVEALINVSIIPLIVFTIPYHVSAVTIFSAYTLMMNVGGHMGYEFFPKGFAANKWFNWHNSATHHNMHHRFVRYNFGIYFNFWDKLMKTNHPKYEESFEQVIVQREQEKLIRDVLRDPAIIAVTFNGPEKALPEL
jgi:sterol desaturase/sphingolipid hydroxylase (fatty acid hydroxylase superfamily)